MNNSTPQIDERTAPADGASVSVWPDSSANKYDLASYGSAPIFKTNIVNGKPVVRFPVGNYGLNNYNNIGVPSPNTLICVANLPVDGRMMNGNGGQIFHIAGGQLSLYDGGLGVGGPNILGAFHVLTAVVNGAASHLFVDGVQVATWTTGGNQVSAVFMMTAGDNVNYYSGDMAEFLIYNSALSTTDRQNVENYLKAKYGL